MPISARNLLLLVCALVANSALGHQGVDTRIEHTDAKLLLAPEDARLNLKRGELHRENQHWLLSWADYERAMANTNDAELQLEILFCMGRMKLQAGSPQQAIELLAQVRAKNPAYKSARLNMARAHYALHQAVAAIAEMDSFIELLERPAPDYYLERARMAESLGTSGQARAIEGLNEGVQRLGPLGSLVDMQVQLYLQSGDTAQALAAIGTLPPKLRRLPSWQIKRGDIYLAAGQQAEAKEAYLSALLAINALPASRQGTPAISSMKEQLCARQGSCESPED